LNSNRTQPHSAAARIAATVSFNLIVYFLIGLPLAVFPGLVHFTLGYSAVLAGFLISLQYAATLMTRALVGRLSDARGPKSAVVAGLACAAVSGGCIILASHGAGSGWILAWLALSRIWLGAAESGTGTGCITWGIGRTSAAHTATVISWNGVASYGGIALGAPAGVLLDHGGGLAALGWTTAGLALAGLAFCSLNPATAVVPGLRMGFFAVLRRVWPLGLAMALGSAGFGTIVAFITLDYAAHGWDNPAYALSAFGLAFVLVRATLSRAIGRFGGFRTASTSLAVEFCGLLLLWLASSPAAAVLGTAVTGLGLSLIFPSLGVEALKTMPGSNRGAGIGVYTVFLDLSLGAVGPSAGILIGQFGYASVYLLAAACAAAGLAMTLRLLTSSSGSQIPRHP
jgi:predicted MFS family arabinose efflux permease